MNLRHAQDVGGQKSEEARELLDSMEVPEISGSEGDDGASGPESDVHPITPGVPRTKTLPPTLPPPPPEESSGVLARIALMSESRTQPLDEAPDSSQDSLPPTVPPPPLSRAVDEPVDFEELVPSGMGLLDLSIRISSALLGGRDAYVTVTLMGGEVLFEGDAGPDGAGGGHVNVRTLIPAGVKQVKVLVEAGSFYRTATVAIREGGATEYLFT